MSVQTYNYATYETYTINAKAGADQVSFYADPSVKAAYQARVLAELQPKIESLARSKFNQLTTKEPGHWFNVGTITTDFIVTESRGDIAFITPFQWDYGINYNIQCKTTVNFQTDISDPKAMSSPQLELALYALWFDLMVAFNEHAVLFLVLAIIIAVIGGTVWIQSQGGVASVIGGPGLMGQITTIAIVGFLGLGLLLLFTTFGQRAARKGYQTASRGYHAARRRLR